MATCPVCKENHEISQCPRWRIPVLLLALCMPVHAIELEQGKVVLTAQEWRSMQNCEALGGCHVVTTAALVAMVESAQKKAVSCRRGDFA